MTKPWFAAAGRRRAPAAALSFAALLAAAPVLAHGPIRKTYQEAPPGTPMPVTPALGPTDLAPPQPATPAGPQPLRLLAAQAKAIVTADVARTEDFDDGRITLHRLHVVRVLRGQVADAEPAVLDMRPDAKVRPLLDAGTRVVVLLGPGPAYSYLTQHLPAGVTPWTVVGGRDGIALLGGDAERDAVERALADGAATAAMSETDALAARRRLAFTELRGTNPRLLADGVAELRLLPDLTPVAGDEVSAVTKVLADAHVDADTRIALIGLVGERGAKECLPALKGASRETPAVLDAVLSARAHLGDPPGRADLDPLLAGDDPGMRAAAVRALARLDDPSALDDVGRFATTDHDAGVRGAAVDALGASHRDAALPVLKRTFHDSSRDVVQRTARALVAIGGPGADATLTDLALHGATAEVQRYAALVLVVTHGRDDPVVQQLAASNPGPEVKSVLEHPLSFGHSHVHD